MEITLDNGWPSVLCCYQEEYYRRLDRPEGTWKRVAVTFLSAIATAIVNYQLYRKVTTAEEQQWSRERSELEVNKQ